MIVVGCPVYDRDWILPLWFERIEAQDWPLSELGFVFVCSSDDEKTVDALFQFQTTHPEVPVFDVVFEDSVSHETHRELGVVSRNWTNLTALSRMVVLRNRLLDRVRQIAPDAFFSLDSDILLDDPSTISRLYKFLELGSVAVSPLVYMSPNTKFPGVMKWVPHAPDWRGLPMAARERGFTPGDTFRTDVIMAAKMMSRAVYEDVDYVLHNKGEDIGWSWNCANHGYELYCMSEVYAPHIMSRTMLELYDAFGDFRNPFTSFGENGDSCATMKTVKLL